MWIGVNREIMGWNRIVHSFSSSDRFCIVCMSQKGPQGPPPIFFLPFGPQFGLKISSGVGGAGGGVGGVRGQVPVLGPPLLTTLRGRLESRWISALSSSYEVPFHGFSTFDCNQLTKLRQDGFKERLTISEDVKFERDLLKTNEEIAPQSLRILQMFVSEGLVQAPHHWTVTTYRYFEQRQFAVCSLWIVSVSLS